jgi:hypothetical protein
LVLFCRRWRSFVQADEKKLGARMGDKCGDAKLPFQGASILRSVLPDRIVLPYLKRGVGVWYRFQNRYLWKIVFPYYALTSFTSPPRHPKWRWYWQGCWTWWQYVVSCKCDIREVTYEFHVVVALQAYVGSALARRNLQHQSVEILGSVMQK